MHLLRYAVKCTVTEFAVEHPNKLLEVFICLDTFSDWCDQRTSNLMKHCSVVDASCRAENSLE